MSIMGNFAEKAQKAPELPNRLRIGRNNVEADVEAGSASLCCLLRILDGCFLADAHVLSTTRLSFWSDGSSANVDGPWGKSIPKFKNQVFADVDLPLYWGAWRKNLCEHVPCLWATGK